MNIVAMLGIVEDDIRYSNSGGLLVCEFTLSIETPLSDEPELFAVITHDRPAELCQRYMHAGDRVIIEGRVSPHPETDVVAHKVERIGRAE